MQKNHHKFALSHSRQHTRIRHTHTHTHGECTDTCATTTRININSRWKVRNKVSLRSVCQRAAAEYFNTKPLRRSRSRVHQFHTSNIQRLHITSPQCVHPNDHRWRSAYPSWQFRQPSYCYPPSVRSFCHPPLWPPHPSACTTS